MHYLLQVGRSIALRRGSNLSWIDDNISISVVVVVVAVAVVVVVVVVL